MSDPIPGGDPTASAEVSASGPATDGDVAQSYFDTEISRIHGRLDEFQQALTHLMNAQEMGNGGHRTEQPQAGAPAGQREEAGISADTRAGGQSGSAAPESEPEPEHAPAPSHWYWRKPFGR